MQKHRLIPHPAMPHPAITLDVEVTWLSETGLRLWYVVSGAVDTIRFAELGEPARVDGLWQTTCFEAFFQIGNGPAYEEVNLAPSRQWAAYGFDSYRAGMRAADINPHEITVATWPGSIALGAELDVGRALAHPASRLALTAVIEETDGTKSYWALAHPSEQPDFHHPDGFVLELPATP